MAQPLSDAHTGPPVVPSSIPFQHAEPAPGFWKKHYGNPESDEIYGVTSNDYETEPEQIKDEKRTGGQAIWFLGAAAVLIFILYVLSKMW